MLGRYEIRSAIGAGGMGEVYSARDTQLGRDVAVKVLPSSFSSDVDRLHRFQQEACAASALNHPNILIVHDIGAHDGSPYVVSELLQGETLRKRIGGTPLAQRRAIDYALQIAHGLAAAHEKAIVHRDLKPENIFVTNDGRVKILDFGLAKLTQGDRNQAQTDIPTRRIDTDPGVVMGTVGYMSPEQLKGRAVDQRSDIFSFGAILYEMLSGQRAFQGESAAETMSAILKEDPPELSDTNQRISPALERLVHHCLEKNPESRFHSARDLAFALEAVGGTSDQAVVPASLPRVPAKARERLIWIALTGILLLVSAGALATLYFRRAPENGKVMRFSISPPDKANYSGNVALSPDGQRIVFRANLEGKAQLWVRALDSLKAQPLPGTDGAVQPFWSPDSRWIGFFASGKLKKMEVTGGPPETLCDAGQFRGGTWNREGVIVFGNSVPEVLYRVSATGGAPTPVTELDGSHKQTSHRHPDFLPDGRHFLYLALSAERAYTGIYVGSLDSKETKLLVNSDASAIYASAGYLLFLRERTLMAQPFDTYKLQLTGEPVSVAEQIVVPGNSRLGIFSVSDNGVLLYRSGGNTSLHLSWFDRGGKQLGRVQSPVPVTQPWLSPDEKRVAVRYWDPQTGYSDIWLLEMARGSSTRLTYDPASDANPVWSPDGSRIVFSSDRDGNFSLYQRAASGAGNDEVLLRAGPDDPKVATDWSLDGRFILYVNGNPRTRADLWVLPLFGDGKPFPFLQENFVEVQAQFSPDGRWVAYRSDKSGKWEVYVQSFPNRGGEWKISTDGGNEPHWRRDGKELFYLSLERKLMAVDVKVTANNFEVGVPKPLFDTHIAVVPDSAFNTFVVSRDGQRFLMNVPDEESAPESLSVVLNWAAGLKH
jgi:serine/threonine protein kinase